MDTGVLGANSDITFTNIPATGTVVFIVDIQAAGYIANWVASGYTFDWSADTAPTLTDRDLVVFTRTAGTTVLKGVHSWKGV